MGEVTRTRHSGRTGLLRQAGVWACVLAAWAAPTREQSPAAPTESQVEAAFLLNFTKFVEWPAAAFRDAASPLTICLLGEEPLGGALDQLVEGEDVNGRKIAVQRIQRAPEPKMCQVLYFSGSGNSVVAAVNAGPGVLTVSDRKSFLREGGIIAFVIEGRHVRFDVNQRAAAKAGLTISARLLSVARSVQR